MRWDNGRESVLVTDIPQEVLDASEVTKRYFERWPMQEKRFCDAKAALNIHRVVGYGKRVEDYDSMKEKYTKLRGSIVRLQRKLRSACAAFVHTAGRFHRSQSRTIQGIGQGYRNGGLYRLLIKEMDKERFRYDNHR